MIISFGFDKGPAPQAEHTFDVREFSHQIESPESQAKIAELAKQITDSNVTVAVGCKMGKHRSVKIANQLARQFRVSVFHRDQGVKSVDTPKLIAKSLSRKS